MKKFYIVLWVFIIIMNLASLILGMRNIFSCLMLGIASLNIGNFNIYNSVLNSITLSLFINIINIIMGLYFFFSLRKILKKEKKI